MTPERPAGPGRAPVLADAALVHAARADLAVLIERWRSAPLGDEVVADVREWLDEQYPPVAAALARMQAPQDTRGVAG